MTNRRASQPEPFAPRGWPERVIELAAAWRAAPTEADSEPFLSELWVLVNTSLVKYLQLQGERFPGIDAETRRDIAADKALDLIRKLDRGAWNPSAWSPAQLCSFVATLARNGLVDSNRSRQRRRRLEQLPDVEAELFRRRAGIGVLEERADVRLDRERFVAALRDCVLELGPKARKVWVFRAFYDLPSKQIARHPDVNMNPPAVDVALARTRDRIAGCMRSKGFSPGDMPPGSFAALWEVLRDRPDVE